MSKNNVLTALPEGVSYLSEAQLLLFWGKTCREEDDPDNFESRYHPLLFHLLDVAHVALELWDEVLPDAFKTRIAFALGCDIDSARWIVGMLAGGHDLGKATPGFQFQPTPLDWLRECLMQLGYEATSGCENKPHSFVTAKELRLFLSKPTSFWQTDKSSGHVLAHITGAHHGTYPKPSDYADWQERDLGDAKWLEVRHALLQHLRAALCAPESVFSKTSWNETAIGAVAQLTGFISVADWIGSSRLFAPVGHRDETFALSNYITESQRRARESVRDFGWKNTPQPHGARSEFAAFWGFAPNALQEAVIVQTRELKSQTAPFFLLIEAPMGIGKTEAALWASDAAQVAGINTGFYIALPTQATSNAMHKRVKKFLSKRYFDEQSIHLQLVHSHAALSDEVDVVLRGLEHIYDFKLTPEEARVVAASWFCGSKRPLLAPFGVGTIDQSLLAALQNRHWFVRLFGLAGKVVIFDEVHAYDTYTNRLLTTLLIWLRELGCSVILLSATLPSSKRRELTRAFGGNLPVEEAAYPRLTWLQGEQETATSIEVARRDLEPKTVAILHLQPDELGEILRDKLKTGGCAAVICNTVVEAQEMSEKLRCEVGDIVPEEGWTLFHARMPFGWRQQIETSVVERFGPNKANRPPCAVVIATQVIEQSLDLDFDWMASFIAPGDLLLQRMGRLHRHPNDDDAQSFNRPALLSKPEMAVLCGVIGDEVPSFGLSAYVYELEMLLRTWLVWRNRRNIELPDDIEPIVKAVYDDEPQAPDAVWQAAIEEAHLVAVQKQRQAEKTADNVVVKSCDEDGRLLHPTQLVDAPLLDLHEDDDPETHKTLRAATRDGDPSVTVICLCKYQNQIYLIDDKGNADTSQPTLDLSAEPTSVLTRKLVKLSLPISNRALFSALCQEKTPSGWRKSPLLRHSRALIFEGGITNVNGYRLRLDRKLGLIIEKEKAEQ